MRELRWSLWLEGDDNLWPRVQRDLVKAFPRLEVEALTALTPEALEQSVDAGAVRLAQQWQLSRHSAYDGRKVRGDADAQSLAYLVLEAATMPEDFDLDAPVDDGQPPRRTLADRAWGDGAGDVLDDAVELGVTQPQAWLQALETGTAAQARRAAEMMFVSYGRKEFAFHGREWPDRAQITAALLRAISVGM